MTKQTTALILLLIAFPLVSLFIYWKMYQASVEDERDGTCKSMIWTRIFGFVMVVVNALVIVRNLVVLSKLK